jgi:hypothetical protein
VQLFAGAEELFSSFNVVHHLLTLVRGSFFNTILAIVFLIYISGENSPLVKHNFPGQGKI